MESENHWDGEIPNGLEEMMSWMRGSGDGGDMYSAQRRLASAYESGMFMMDPDSLPDRLARYYDLQNMIAMAGDPNTSEEDAQWVIDEFESLYRRIKEG